MADDDVPQLGRLEVEALAKKPGKLHEAWQAGQLKQLLAGNDPSACPTCKRPMADPGATNLR